MSEDFGRISRPGWRDRRSPERQPCACGGDIERQAYESIAVVVRRHNRSAGHARWWERVKGTWQ